MSRKRLFYAFSLALVFVILLVARSWLPSYPRANSRTTAQNTTLGFGAIYVLTCDTSTWRVQGLRRAAELVGLDLTVPVQEKLGDDEALAYLEGNEQTEVVNEIKTVLNYAALLEEFLRSNYETALFFEDDVDFSIHLKPQMQLLSDIIHKNSPAAHRPVEQDPAEHSAPLWSDQYPYEQDLWDVLWFGHFGLQHTATTEIWQYTDPFAIPWNQLTSDFNDYYRWPHESQEVLLHVAPLASFAFALSRAAAMRILSHRSEVKAQKFDLALHILCKELNLRCVATAPELVHHHKVDGEVSIRDQGAVDNVPHDLAWWKRRHKYTYNIAESARCAAGRSGELIGKTWRCMPALNDKVAEGEPIAVKRPSKTKRKVSTDEGDFEDELSQGSKRSRKALTAAKPDSKPGVPFYHTTTYNELVGRHIKHLFFTDCAAVRRIALNNRVAKKLQPGGPEQRLRPYIGTESKKNKDTLKKAKSERNFVLDRERSIEDDCHAGHTNCPCENIDIAGSTGDVYTVKISHIPSCTCPVGIFTRKGSEQLCKHALYVLHNVLKVSQQLEKQTAFLTSELREIFDSAPPLPSQIVADDEENGNRKPVEDDCPICCMEFEDGEDVVWCRAACGNNIHATCFKQWEKTKPLRVTCPFCRTDWEHDEVVSKQKLEVLAVNKAASRGKGGYRNVKDQLDYD